MTAANMGQRVEYRVIQELNVFYQYGVSKLGHPVYYFIARRYKLAILI